jgi:hypothetical protein
VSNLVLVPKKNGQTRICVDLRNNNKVIVPDKFPLLTFEELSAEFKGSSCFTKLGLNSSYLQLELDEEARDLTPFNSGKGLFRYRRVCFGLSSAPAAFQKVLATTLDKPPGSINYIDDVVVHGPSREVHDERLVKVLDLFLKHNI